MDDATNVKLHELRSEIISLTGVVIQIHSVLTMIRPYGDTGNADEVGKRMVELGNRIDKLLGELGGDSFNG